MSERSSIKDKLVQIVTEDLVFKEGWRRIGTGDANGLVPAFTAEIDQTLLPRRLAFKNQDDAVLFLDAANRRIRRFVSPAPDKQATHSALFDTAFAAPNTQILGQIGSILTGHLAGCAYLWVRSSRLTGGGQVAQSGISAIDLHKAFSASVEPNPSAEPDQILENFKAALFRHCETWVQCDGTRSEVSSDEKIGDALLKSVIRADWRNRTKANGASPHQNDAPRCCVLTSSSEPKTCIVLVSHESFCLIARTIGPNAGEISALWRKSLSVPDSAGSNSVN